MDALDGLLSEARARATVFSEAATAAPWSLRFAGEAPLALVTMLRGSGWIVRGRTAPVRVDSGDLALVVGPRRFTVAGDPEAAPTIVVHDPDTHTGPRGAALTEQVQSGLRTRGVDMDGSDVVLTAAYQVGGHLCRRLLDALPSVLVVPVTEYRCPLFDLIATEVTREYPGQRLVVDRLLDLLLVFTVRAWFRRPGAQPPAWYSALDDPVVGPALRILHDDPAHPWTVASLAEKIGASRAGLAGRFVRLVGEPPMKYLASWRISLAADMLHTTDATVATIATQVGYGTPFALSAAFLRIHGMRPSEYRIAARVRRG